MAGRVVEMLPAAQVAVRRRPRARDHAPERVELVRVRHCPRRIRQRTHIPVPIANEYSLVVRRNRNSGVEQYDVGRQAR